MSSERAKGSVCTPALLHKSGARVLWGGLAQAGERVCTRCLHTSVQRCGCVQEGGCWSTCKKCTSVLLLVQGWGFHVLGRARRWVCTGIFALEGGGVAHRCARLSVQKVCEQGASFALGRAKVLHSRVCTACRCARAECASVCSHEGFCTWILHVDFARLCVLHAGVTEAGLVLRLLCKVSVQKARVRGGLDFAQARDLHICKWGG